MQRISPIGIPTVTASVLAACLLSSCVQRPPLVVQSASGEIVPLESWTADLSANAALDSSGLKGTAMLVPGSNIRETQAMVTLAGGTPDAVYPWYVQLGDCGNDRGVLASLMAYPPIALDRSGQATTTVTLPFTLPTRGRYFVSVRRSETEVSTVIACGNLTKASDSNSRKAGYAKAP
jgi:hypothetical protein